MKTKKIILLFFSILALLITSTSCSDSDLNLVDPTNLSPESFFKTEPQIESSVNVVYANLQTIGLFTRAYFFMFDLMGGDASGNPQLESDKVQYANFSFDANHANIGDYWESCYRGINKANFVIGNSDKINALPESIISQEKKNKFIGEAKFLRALYYFLLVNRWGDIPLITEIPTTAEGYPRSPKEEIYNLIISDLQTASADLLDKGVEQKGRATKQAAIALLGKVYLYLEKYDLALAEFNKLNGKFSLEPNYFDNFMDEKEFGPESIFEIGFDEKLGAGDIWNSGYDGIGQNESTLRGQEYGFNDWFNTYPANNLLAEYETADTRYSDSFYTNGSIFEGDPKKRTIRTGVKPAVVPATEIYIPLERASAWRKYQNYYKRVNENINSSINFKFMRYADVLLMMAECESLREGGNQSIAIGYINQVRQRPSVMLPALALTLSKAEVFDAIIHERRVELAGEQSRFNDLVRWGKAESVLGSLGYKAKNKLWPIPAREISSNPAISETDQNPGY